MLKVKETIYNVVGDRVISNTVETDVDIDEIFYFKIQKKNQNSTYYYKCFECGTFCSYQHISKNFRDIEKAKKNDLICKHCEYKYYSKFGHVAYDSINRKKQSDE